MKRSFRSYFKLRYLLILGFVPLLWWAIRDISLNDVRGIIGRLGLPQLALLAVINLLVLIAFNSRWYIILRSQGYRLPYFSLLRYRTTAFSISYFTPGTQFGGEPLQVYMLENRHKIPGAIALSAVTLDKLFELLANFTFLALGAALVLQHGILAAGTSQRALIWIGGLLFLPLIYIGALATGRQPLTWLMSILQKGSRYGFNLEKALPLVKSSEGQISSLFRNQPIAILGVILVSVLIWILSITEYWLALSLLGGPLNLTQAIIALTAARIAFLTPLPGGLGALEASQVFAVGALGFNPALGISISLWIRSRDVALALLGLGLGSMLSSRSFAQPPASQAGD